MPKNFRGIPRKTWLEPVKVGDKYSILHLKITGLTFSKKFRRAFNTSGAMGYTVEKQVTIMKPDDTVVITGLASSNSPLSPSVFDSISLLPDLKTIKVNLADEFTEASIGTCRYQLKAVITRNGLVSQHISAPGEFECVGGHALDIFD